MHVSVALLQTWHTLSQQVKIKLQLKLKFPLDTFIPSRYFLLNHWIKNSHDQATIFPFIPTTITVMHAHTHTTVLQLLFPSEANSIVPKFPYFTWVSGQQILFFFLPPPYTAINNGCFSGLQSARREGWKWADGRYKRKKNQGKRLGLVREFLCEINRFSWAAGSGCGTCGVNCNWTLSLKTVVRAWPASHVRSPPLTSWPCKQNYRMAFIFLETVPPHAVKSVWSAHFCKQYDRRRLAAAMVWRKQKSAIAVRTIEFPQWITHAALMEVR